MSPSSHYSQIIKEESQRLGFLSCGISKADFLEDDAPKLEQWLKNNYHGDMSYMENHFDMRLDPRLILDGAKSVISLSYNYYTTDAPKSQDTFKISKYAYGKDYHKVIKKKGYKLLKFIREKIGAVNARVFVDSAPLLERTWAKRSGIGWVGKNSNLITKKVGSFFFLAELVIDLELEPDTTVTDHCGSCTKCIDACPTEAITRPYEIDSNKCISYLTIEYKKELPYELSDKMNNFIFGCDICQDVCPWNKFSEPNNEPDFKPHKDLLSMSTSDWEVITDGTFKNLFKNSAVQRTKFSGLKRNIDFLIPKK